MPKNVPAELEEKFASCKEKVIASGQTEDAAYGICYVSVVEGKSLSEATQNYYLNADALKAGRMISQANAEIIKSIISLAKQLVPDEEPEAEDDMGEMGNMHAQHMQMQDEMKGGDLIISYGDCAIKSSNGSLSGYAVRFGGSDLAGEGFTAETNYGFAGENTKRVDILLHHAQPMATKSGASVQVTEPIGTATLRMVDDGIIVEDAILYTAEKYAKYLDKLGWSTGAAAHAVVRDGKTIKQWQIAEVSLTPFPAEPRNMVAAKSLAGEMVEEAIDYRKIGRVVGAKIIQQLRVTAR